MTDILDLDGVANLLKVSKRTVQREVEAGKLEAFRVGRSLRFRSEAVEEYMRKQRIAPGEKLDGEDSVEDVA
jgi:excisionase family DNA binding protein